MPASTLMVKSRGSYWRTRGVAAVEMVILDGARGPPISRLEKCPPNSIVWWRADAQPMASASSSGLCGRTISVEQSGIRVEEQVVQNVVKNGEHDRPEERGQKAPHRESGHEDGCQLQEECVQDQPKQAQGEQRQGKSKEPQRPSDQRIHDGDYHRGDQRGAIAPDLDAGNNARQKPQGQRAEHPVYEQVHNGPPEIHNKPMSRLFAGTSGFAYAQWKPRFYPAKLPANKFLEHYAQRLTSVEINYTFRRMPSAGTLENWVAATPPGFLFALKAHMRI